MTGRDDDGHVTCECNHLSIFTILVVSTANEAHALLITMHSSGCQGISVCVQANSCHAMGLYSASSYSCLQNIDQQPGTPVPVPDVGVQAIIYVGLAVSIVAVVVCLVSYLIPK